MSSPLTAHPPATPQTAARYVVLAGNPNSGKTTLFNSLTGLRAKVGNYPGVTVERKEGRLAGSARSNPVRVLDLPGAYSLTPQSLDEEVARDILFHRLPEVPPPDLVVVIVDASNLQRNLYFATQVIELGYPTFVALNMMDVAEQNGHRIDATQLSQDLGVPVFPLVASAGQGIPELRAAILARLDEPAAAVPRRFCTLPAAFQEETVRLTELLVATFPRSRFQAGAEAVLLLSDERFLDHSSSHYPAAVSAAVEAARARLGQAGLEWRSLTIEARYGTIASIQERVTQETAAETETFSDKLDRVVTHRVWGLLLFVAVMTLIFQSIFSFARQPMAWLEHGVEWVAGLVDRLLAPGPLHSLIADGIIAGVGAVVVFLPQICLLFFFIGLLEDTGYMARAAFLMDRLMSKVGLHGKSFIPMLSSFACAIPGIMATRTIESPKDRLATILVAPLMSCSARLPVYTVLIAACVPSRRVLGLFGLQGLTLLGMYLLGVIVALLMAWLFKRTLLRGPTPLLIMELPPYKRPLLRVVLRHMWDRSRLFLRRAGTVILGFTIILWFLASYPKIHPAAPPPGSSPAPIDAPGAQTLPLPGQTLPVAAGEQENPGEQLRYSFAGRLGKLIEPVIAPLGFDWKIGIGIIGSFAAREVFVSTMSLVYNVGEMGDSEEATRTLAETMQGQRRPDGSRLYTPLTGLSLMVFYVFALQCVSTVAVVHRETNSWKWPLFQWAYMGALAWVLAFLTYQGGRLFGWA